MAKQTINLGTAPTGSGGDTPRTAFQKVIDNFTELYGAFGATGDSAALPAALPVSKGGTGGTSQPFTRANSVGTVSQASGAPTGAIIETGTNANGTYTKWADGTMICERRVTWTGAVNIALNGGYYASGPAAQAFPANFVAAPIQNISISTDSPSTAWIGGRGVGGAATWGLCYIMELFSRSSQTYFLEYTAIGRWF